MFWTVLGYVAVWALASVAVLVGYLVIEARARRRQGEVTTPEDVDEGSDEDSG